MARDLTIQFRGRSKRTLANLGSNPIVSVPIRQSREFLKKAQAEGLRVRWSTTNVAKHAQKIVRAEFPEIKSQHISQVVPVKVNHQQLTPGDIQQKVSVIKERAKPTPTKFTSGTISAADQSRINKIRTSLAKSEEKLGKIITDRQTTPTKGTTAILTSAGIGAIQGLAELGDLAKLIVTQPTVFGRALLQAAKNPRKIQDALAQDFSRNPASFAGELIGFSRGLGKVSKIIKAAAKTIKITKVKLPKGVGTIEVTAIGLEKGTRAKILGAIQKVKTEELLTKKGIDLSKLKTKEITELLKKEKPQVKLIIGANIKKKIKLKELPKGIEIPQPEEALKGKVFRNVLDFSDKEIERIETIVKIGRRVRKEKGLPVKKIVFNIEGLKNKNKASKIIEDVVAKEDGMFFGSATTQQLPKKFVIKKVGDVDVFFPDKTVVQIEQINKGLVKRLKASGENVRISPDNPTIIEFTKTRGKLFEAKSGIDHETLGEELAPTGFLGFEFADIKAGGVPRTVAFGKAKATTAGEQFLRKGSAALIVKGKSGKVQSIPVPFQQPGVVGAARRIEKDIAGLIIQGRGIGELKGASKNFFSKIKGARTKADIEKVFNTFTPEQQKVIAKKIEELTKGDFKVPLEVSSQRVGTSPKGSPIIQGRLISPSPKMIEKLPSPTPSIPPSVSPKIPSISPKLLSTTLSKTISKIISRTPSVSSTSLSKSIISEVSKKTSVTPSKITSTGLSKTLSKILSKELSKTSPSPSALSKSAFMEISKSPSVSVPKTKVPVSQILKKMEKIVEKAPKGKMPGFIPQALLKRKWKTLSSKVLSKKKAGDLAEEFTDKTIAAQFRLLKKGFVKKKKSENKYSPSNKFRAFTIFRKTGKPKASLPPLQWIEKRKFRLDTKSEVRKLLSVPKKPRKKRRRRKR